MLYYECHRLNLNGIFQSTQPVAGLHLKFCVEPHVFRHAYRQNRKRSHGPLLKTVLSNHGLRVDPGLFFSDPQELAKVLQCV